MKSMSLPASGLGLVLFLMGGIQTRDGLLHITYTWKRLRVKHVVLDPKSLELRPIVNDGWPD